jgi:hypothetical protein
MSELIIWKTMELSSKNSWNEGRKTMTDESLRFKSSRFAFKVSDRI